MTCFIGMSALHPLNARDADKLGAPEAGCSFMALGVDAERKVAVPGHNAELEGLLVLARLLHEMLRKN
ncbi:MULTISPECIES: hypothetical protein [Brevundimonas]|uniref:hypothetical protein n=1 Tax=Brevundimonas TaxID=41275 RepID=UPI001905701E|nr:MULTISPECIES: hypothetical protein [Brevundimonas]MBK1967810.1 hypothetical protein [Brevundimonas diminuta]MBK1977031.1 hypothetical protein [Brevundimonas diminuta]